MSPLQVCRAFLALKAHFTTDRYDVIKSKGRFSVTTKYFEGRKDRYRFEEMSKTMKDDEIISFFIANMTRKADYYSPLDAQSEQRYRDWQKHNQSLSYNFGNEVKTLFEVAHDDGICYNDVFFSSESQHPPVLTAFMGKDISIETFIILDRLNRFTEKLVSDVVTESILRTARKYDPFLKVDLDTYDNITQRVREQVYT